MVRHRRKAPDSRLDKLDRGSAVYMLILGGPDGQPRQEPFTDVAAYRARLLALRHSIEGSISIDEIARLLDT